MVTHTHTHSHTHTHTHTHIHTHTHTHTFTHTHTHTHTHIHTHTHTHICTHMYVCMHRLCSQFSIRCWVTAFVLCSRCSTFALTRRIALRDFYLETHWHRCFPASRAFTSSTTTSCSKNWRRGCRVGQWSHQSLLLLFELVMAAQGSQCFGCGGSYSCCQPDLFQSANISKGQIWLWTGRASNGVWPDEEELALSSEAEQIDSSCLATFLKKGEWVIQW